MPEEYLRVHWRGMPHAYMPRILRNANDNTIYGLIMYGVHDIFFRDDTTDIMSSYAIGRRG